jgi:S-methylmethionine-dependent homocysteine/selenocysteine methylase
MFRSALPQLISPVFLTDGGLETSLIYDDGLELVDFAAFSLLDSAAGAAAISRYYEAYVAIALRDRVGVVLDTATWRASLDWAARQGYDTEKLIALNTAAVDLLVDIRARYQTPTTPIVISGCIGPRGDGYRPDALMSVDEAQSYHGLQARTFADSAADLITALTMTYPAEAIGVAHAARAVEMPVVISFTVETDGTLPTGASLAEAIEAVDAVTDAYPAYYMVNCAHPSHFADVLQPGAAWSKRIGGIRANASTMSHAELDQATELDAGDPIALAASYRELRERLPHLVVLGGCCGTNHRHIDAISTTCAA